MKNRKLIIFLLIIIGLAVFSVYYPDIIERNTLDKNYEKEKCFVNRIIDGDTLVCNNETIRLLGIDTPEKGEYYYEEAKDFLKNVENKEVYVLRDWDDLGKYYRKLRYVFYEDRLINIEILENGFGKSFMTENLKYEDKLKKAEEFAKENKKGLWGIK